MKVALADKAKTQLAGLDKVTQIRIVKKFLHVEKTGVAALERMRDVPFFKLRIGDYRAIGSVDLSTFCVVFIGHRSKVYKEFQ